MLNSSLVGKEYWGATLAVEAGAVLRFADAVGDTSCRRDGAVLEAPSTFVLALVPWDALAALLPAAPAEIHQSEVQIELHRPVCAGDRLRIASKVVDVARHSGTLGATDILTLDDEGWDLATGKPVFRARRVYAIRSPKVSE